MNVLKYLAGIVKRVNNNELLSSSLNSSDTCQANPLKLVQCNLHPVRVMYQALTSGSALQIF